MRTRIAVVGGGGGRGWTKTRVQRDDGAWGGHRALSTGHTKGCMSSRMHTRGPSTDLRVDGGEDIISCQTSWKGRRQRLKPVPILQTPLGHQHGLKWRQQCHRLCWRHCLLLGARFIGLVFPVAFHHG